MGLKSFCSLGYGAQELLLSWVLELKDLALACAPRMNEKEKRRRLKYVYNYSWSLLIGHSLARPIPLCQVTWGEPLTCVCECSLERGRSTFFIWQGTSCPCAREGSLWALDAFALKALLHMMANMGEKGGERWQKSKKRYPHKGGRIFLVRGSAHTPPNFTFSCPPCPYFARCPVTLTCRAYLGLGHETET